MTAFHHKVTQRLKEIRSDQTGTWLSPNDVAYAYRPLKMGLRISNLHEPWREFEETYDRVNHTCSQLFNLELTKEERDGDLEAFKQARDILKKNQMINDTSMILN